MSDTSKPDYGEPWQNKDGDFEIYPNTGGEAVAYAESSQTRDRIIACVNACAGMADPEKEIAELRQALSGRTVSCEQCNTLATENQAMREAIREAYENLETLECLMRESRGLAGYHLNGDIAEWDSFDINARDALTKLKPFTTP